MSIDMIYTHHRTQLRNESPWESRLQISAAASSASPYVSGWSGIGRTELVFDGDEKPQLIEAGDGPWDERIGNVLGVRDGVVGCCVDAYLPERGSPLEPVKYSPLKAE